MYGKMQEAVFLPYPLTPHVTLTYYRPGRYSQKKVKKLEETFRMLSSERFLLNLRTENLVYQEFSDMNHYRSVH